MLIEIHAIQNHSPANLNRDDLGAPKSCYFGGVLRSRISSQCLKRSIRMSDEFKQLLGGIRTRRLAQRIAGNGPDSEGRLRRATEILDLCGIGPKKSGRSVGPRDDEKSAGLVYVSVEAVEKMSRLLRDAGGNSDEKLAREFAQLITTYTGAPDMALCGRMLEPRSGKKSGAEKVDGNSKEDGVWKGLDTCVEAALQVAHAISTHEARPEVDYFVAADDIPGEDAGAGYVDEALYASACFYKYFSIHWETLVQNLNGNKELAAHTVGAFIRGAALANPTGKQNSYAAHNNPDGMLIELRNIPISYANAFAKPVETGARDIISQSVAQLGQYIHDMDIGFGRPAKRLWFSPNLRYPLTVTEGREEIALADDSIKALELLISAIIKEVGYDWEEVRKVAANTEGR